MNPATCSCENGKFASIMGDSSITCDEVIESYDEDADTEAHSNDEAKLYDEIKTIPRNFNEKNATCKTQKLDVLLTFSLITILKI